MGLFAKDRLVPVPVGPSRVDVHTDIDVTVKRAPTDESVKLLREMEAAAKAEVLKTVRVSDGVFDGVVHHFKDGLNAQDVWHCVFKVNGQRMEAEVRRFWHTKGRYEPEALAEIYQELADEVGRVMAREALRVPFLKATQNLFP